MIRLLGWALLFVAMVVLLSQRTKTSQVLGPMTELPVKAKADNAIARVLIDAEGTHDGAAPDGYAELHVRAQDELRDRSGKVLASSDVNGGIRAQSHSYGYSDDPKAGRCRDTQCPDYTEVWSDKNTRITSSGGVVDIVTGSQQRIVIDRAGSIRFPNLRSDRPKPSPLCVTDHGVLMLCP